jgi:hypothetical protein
VPDPSINNVTTLQTLQTRSATRHWLMRTAMSFSPTPLREPSAPWAASGSRARRTRIST